MAFAFHHEDLHNVNEWVFRLKELVISHGGAVLASGDGLAAYSASGDVCTSIQSTVSPTATAANSLSNTNAWIRLRLPGGVGRPELLLWRRTSGSSTFIAFVSVLGFTGGSPSATVAPTAADQCRILGTNDTTAQDVYTESLTSYVSCHLDACFGDVDEDYAFYVLIRRAHARDIGGFFFDATDGAKAGDAYPYLFSWVRGTISTSTTFLQVTSTGFPSDSNRTEFFWGRNAEGTDTGFRPYTFVVPTEFHSEADPYGTFRYIGAPRYARFGNQRTPPTNLTDGWPEKGASRLFVGTGNGAAAELAIITTPDNGLCIDNGRFILRWDGTAPRM